MDEKGSKAETALQTLTCNREKKELNWEKYVSCHVKYHNVLENLTEYGYQGLDPGTKALLNVLGMKSWLQ